MGIFSSFFGSNNKLQDIVDAGAFLVDVRTPGEFAEGHVPGSVNIPLDSIQANLEKFRNKENIVVFCRSGNRSGQAKSILERNGFNNVTNGGTWQSVKQLVK